MANERRAPHDAAGRGPSDRSGGETLSTQQARQGMVVFDYQKQYAEAGKQIAQWMMQGELKVREHVVEGLDNFPEALAMLFSGGNHGKLVLKI